MISLSQKDPVEYWSQASDPAQVRKWIRRIQRRAFVWRMTIHTAEFLKRSIDVIGAVLGLLFFAPIVLLIAFVTKGPILTKERRIGKGGQCFFMWRLSSGFAQKIGISETPQFYNVLVGDMALIGPRPSTPKDVERYNSFHLRRLTVKPGMLSFWQSHGREEIESRVRLDLQFIRSESFFGNLRILMQTVPAVILGRGAY